MKKNWGVCKMSDEISKHATLVEIAGKGVLLCGKSGAGKSDLAFRLIENHKAVLVADDVVLFTLQNGELYGEAPEKLKGLLEVRGVGIAKYPYFEKCKIDLVVDLLEEKEKIERLPDLLKVRFFDFELLYLRLHAFEASAPQKILLKLRDNLLKSE